MSQPLILSIQVGLPRERGTAGASDPLDRPWTSGFDKRPVTGPVRCGATNLAGDGQADLVYHGGPDKAVLAYSAEHYALWRRELEMPDLPLGAFGENLTIAGLTEADVCLGDEWQCGQVKLQVSQPRQPCWKLARHWRIKSLPLEVQQSGRTGWYLRVLTEGTLAAGMPIERTRRPYPSWTIARANRVMHHDKSDLAAAAELATLATLPTSWRTTLLKRVEQNVHPDTAKRLYGPNESPEQVPPGHRRG